MEKENSKPSYADLENQKEKRAIELIVANKELTFQNREKEKRADELIMANKELAFQNKEKRKRAAELIIINKKLAFQYKEKKKRTAELIIANKELNLQNREKEILADDLFMANKELCFQNREKEKRADELILLNEELALQIEETEKQAEELIHINKKLIRAKAEISELNKSLEEKVARRTGELELANQTKDKFFSIIAHDLKNPFAGLLSSCEVLKRCIENEDLPKIKKFAESIYRTSQYAYTLLENLLEWASLQLGNIEAQKETFDIVFLIEDALLCLHNFAHEKNISIELINHSTEPYNAVFDLEMFKTIVRNLVTNAIKFSQTGNTILVEILDSDENHMKINVTDSGIGISKDDIDKLFKIDVSHISYGTNDETGTGLGLLLCKEFALKNGSDIFVESELNKGSTFSFIVEKELVACVN